MNVDDLDELVMKMMGASEGAEIVTTEGETSGAAKPPETLVNFHLQQVAPRAGLTSDLSQKAHAGTVDLYNRLKARDAVDSIYCRMIVAVLNSSMRAYDEARLGSRREEKLQLAYERTEFLMALITARENRLAVLEDRSGREKAIEQLMRRYGLDASPSTQEG